MNISYRLRPDLSLPILIRNLPEMLRPLTGRIFDDELVKRQFSHIADIGTDALTDLSKLKKVRSTICNLASIRLLQERFDGLVASDIVYEKM